MFIILDIIFNTFSYKEIQEPNIDECEDGRDFGKAFYTTEIKEQAERWAKRKEKIELRLQNKEAKATVSVFEFDEDTDSIKTKDSEVPDMEWLNMIISCRSNKNFKHSYDIVSGKIADDSVGETVQFVIEGIMKKEDAIERLKFQEINSQIAFCTKDSLKRIKFIKSYEVK